MINGDENEAENENEVQLMKKLNNNEAELKKSVFCKKSMYLSLKFVVPFF